MLVKKNIVARVWLAACVELDFTGQVPLTLPRIVYEGVVPI